MYRLHVWLVVVAIGAVLNVRVSALESQMLQRVRPTSSLVAVAVSDGNQRSATFRRLVATVDASDGLVYIDEGSCPFGARACLTLSLVVAGPYRILHIHVDPRWARDCELVVAVGHELQHAVEVLENPRIRSTGELYQFFDRVGHTGREIFETQRAIRAGMDVHDEACGGVRHESRIVGQGRHPDITFCMADLETDRSVVARESRTSDHLSSNGVQFPRLF
jgi:hypothetical protein